MLLYVLVLVMSSLRIAVATDYYVVPDGEFTADVNNTHTLDYYLNDSSKYFSKLHFKQGEYHLENDFTLANIHNVSITGHGASIICKPYVGVTFINITNITLKDMKFVNCVKCHRDYFTLNYSQYMNDNIFTNKEYRYSEQASVMFYNSSVTVRNVSVQCNTGVHALMIVNAMAAVTLSDITVLVNFTQASNSSIISSGIFLHFYISLLTNNVSVSLTNLEFEKGYHSMHINFSFIAIKFLLSESNLSVNISVTNMTFANFYNSIGLF